MVEFLVTTALDHATTPLYDAHVRSDGDRRSLLLRLRAFRTLSASALPKCTCTIALNVLQTACAKQRGILHVKMRGVFRRCE